MTAADVASISLHSDVYSVLQLMSPQDTTTTEEHEVSIHRSKFYTIFRESCEFAHTEQAMLAALLLSTSRLTTNRW